MKVTLLEGYFIDIDSLNYTLKKKSREQRKDGTEYDSEKTIGYFGNLKGAVERFLQESQQDADVVVSLRGYVDRVEKSNREKAAFIEERLEKHINQRNTVYKMSEREDDKDV